MQLHVLYSSWNSPGQNTEVDSHSLLQGIFPTQGLNQDLPHCGQILYHLSHQGSPRILEWVTYPFSSRSPQLRSQTRVSCTAGFLKDLINFSLKPERKRKAFFHQSLSPLAKGGPAYVNSLLLILVNYLCLSIDLVSLVWYRDTPIRDK